jgi:shikimate kinase
MHEPDLPNLILIGFMGAGKTTVGRTLAQLGGLRFIDLDAEIIRSAGRSITEIFAQDGEEHFRDLEAAALLSFADQQRLVLATGGGLVGRPDNWEAMRRLGRIVYLQVSWEVLQRRLASSTDRPLLRVDGGWALIRDLYERRIALYQQADVTVDGEGDSRQVAEAILQLMKNETGRSCR